MKSVYRVFLHTRKDMRVDVHRHADLRMTEQLLKKIRKVLLQANKQVQFILQIG